MVPGPSEWTAGQPGSPMNRLVLASLAAVLVTATGCASVPMMPDADDLAAKTFPAPPAGQAQVYVYRHESMGGAIKLGLLLDGFLVGESAAKTYFVVPLAPGKHVIGSTAENRDELPLEAVEGKTYFVWQEVKMGFLQAGTKLSLADEATGKAAVNECKRAQATLPQAPPAPKPAGVPAS